MSEKNSAGGDQAQMLPKYEEAMGERQGPPNQMPQQVEYGQPVQPLIYGHPGVMVQYPPGTSGQPAPPDYFLLSLLVTLFCFCPTGFIALMRASDARSAVARGDYQSGYRYAKEAKKFITISVVVGIVCLVVCVVLTVLYVTWILKKIQEL